MKAQRILMAWLILMITVGMLRAQSANMAQSGSDTSEAWPSIRGPLGNGVSLETELVSAWGNHGPPVLWTRELGQGFSSFVAWDHRVATQYQTLGGQYLICMDADTGQTIWEHRYAWPYEVAGVYPGPRSSPVYSENAVYFTSPDGTLTCVEANQGHPRWSIALYQRFRAKPPGFGYACNPTVVGDRVIVPVGGDGSSLVAFDKHSGQVIWQSGSDSPSYCSLQPITWKEKTFLVGYLQNALVIHDANDGRLVARKVLSSGYDEHSVWPLYQEPFLWIAYAFQGGSELYSLGQGDDPELTLLRRSQLLSNDIFSSVLYQGIIYGFDLQEAQAKTHRTSRGVFRCVDLVSGKENWSVGAGRIRRMPISSDAASTPSLKASSLAPEVGHATVLVADGKLILFNDLGELILATATPDRYEELARVSLLSGEICWTQPCLANRRLFVRNHSRAVCVILGDPSREKQPFGTRLLRVEDIPQHTYRDWAGTLLSIEPEYLFDPPSNAWLLRWYWVSIAMVALAYTIAWSESMVNNRRAQHIAKDKRQEVVFSLSAFLLGALGTSWMSYWLQDFVFTWHVSLFAAWHWVIVNTTLRRPEQSLYAKWTASLPFWIWLASCLVYFLLCRRLSLVFEWVFLLGFLATLPFYGFEHVGIRDRPERQYWRPVCYLIAFSAYYASSILFLPRSVP